MALETLKGITEIDNYKIADKYAGWQWEEFILLDHSNNILAFKIQNGPIKEMGINGCQVDQLISAAKIIIEGLNAKFPCRENSIAITKLEEASMWLEKRKKNREKRGVEGFSKI